jgi:hypothetical protein
MSYGAHINAGQCARQAIWDITICYENDVIVLNFCGLVICRPGFPINWTGHLAYGFSFENAGRGWPRDGFFNFGRLKKKFGIFAGL